MCNPIEGFVQELTSELSKSLGPYEASVIAQEVEAHLQERSLALQELGSPEAEAQLEAIRSFGSNQEVVSWFQPQPKDTTLSPLASEALVGLGWMMPWLFMLWPAPFLNGLQLLLITLPAAFSRRFPYVACILGLFFATHLEIWHALNSGRNIWISWPISVAAVIGLTLAPFLAGWLTRSVTNRHRRFRLG